MKIIAFGASNSKNSINKQLVTFATNYFAEQKIEILDLNDYEMPIFSIDRLNDEGIHPLAIEFADKIRQADFILISFAEHNSAYTTAFKNIFDWTSRIRPRDMWKGKNLFIMATSEGPRGGHSVLTLAASRLPRDGANVLETFCLPNFNENFDDLTGISEPELLEEFETKIIKVKSIIKRY